MSQRIREQLGLHGCYMSHRLRESCKDGIYRDFAGNSTPLVQHGCTATPLSDKTILINKVCRINALRRRGSFWRPTERVKMAIMICSKCNGLVDLDTNIEDWNEEQECCVGCEVEK